MSRQEREEMCLLMSMSLMLDLFQTILLSTESWKSLETKVKFLGAIYPRLGDSGEGHSCVVSVCWRSSVCMSGWIFTTICILHWSISVSPMTLSLPTLPGPAQRCSKWDWPYSQLYLLCKANVSTEIFYHNNVHFLSFPSCQVQPQTVITAVYTFCKCQHRITIDALFQTYYGITHYTYQTNSSHALSQSATAHSTQS